MKKYKGYTIIDNPRLRVYTKGEYERLGNRLRTFDMQSEIPIEDLKMLQTFRTSYKEPLSQVFEILRKSILKIDKNAIVTYRVKRIESIISKLKRLDKAQLPRIEDIAGCRCILKNNEQVYRLKEILKDELYIKSDRNDYIANPKPDGYKSLHLIVQTKNRESNPIEIQLRCEKDHNWATLVEIVDQIYNTKIKELGNENELGRLLLLLSVEINSLKKDELVELIDLIIKKEFVGKISSVFFNNSIKVRKQWSEINKKSGNNFYLIRVDKQNNSYISSFSSFNGAERIYFQEFQANPSWNMVLTHIPDAKFEQIAKAYSNYTLTYHDFMQDFSSKLQELVKIAFVENKTKEFIKYFTLFVQTYFETAKLQYNELLIMNKTKCKGLKKYEWESDLKQRIEKIINGRKKLFSDMQVRRINLYQYYFDYKMKKIWRMYANTFAVETYEMYQCLK